MKTFAWLLTAVLASQAAPPPAQTGTGVIRGRVVRAVSTEAIDDAQIFLNRGSTTAGPAAGQARAGTTVSDREGNFEFRDLAPGRYTVTAQRKGYSGPFTGSPEPSVSVTVSNGQTAEAVVSMTATGVIRGRVRDASGQFPSNVEVDAIEIAYRNGLPYLMPVVSKRTDDRGEYRLYGLPPGDYYIAATPRPLSPIALLAGAGYSAKTFFPGAVDITRATRVTIQGGEEIPNIDIGIQTPQTYKVSGTVSTTLAAAPPRPDAEGVFVVIQQNQNNRISVLLVSRDPAQPQDERNGSSGIFVPLNAAGPFEIPNVLPGSYELMAFFGNGEAPAIARTVVDIRNQDVSGIALTIRQGFEVKGKVSADGKAPAANAVLLAFEPTDSLKRLGVAIPANIDADGSFSFPQMPEGRFRVTADRMGPDLYVEDMRQGNVSVFDSGFEIRGRSPEPLEVLLRSGAASVEGSLQDSAGKPLIGGRVALVPATRRENPMLYFTTTADSAGNFVIRGVVPGEYKLFSWDYMPPGAVSNEAFLQKYEEKGIAISLAAGAKITQKVTAIPR
jgi:hypothetical protein